MIARPERASGDVVDWKLLLLVPATVGLIAFLWWLRKQAARFHIFGELWAFMRVRKKWWLGPVIVFLVFLSFIIVFAESNALAPFIYRLF